MNISVGIDIIKFKRIENIYNKYGIKIIKRILSNYEIKRLPEKNNIISYISKCFAVKEAFSKAIGSGFRQNINLYDINIYKNHLGKPHIYISGKSKNFLFLNDIQNIELSITDENDYIISFVIINYKKK